MTDLIDRLSGESRNHDPARPKIPVHQFNAGLGLYIAGTITAAEAKQDYDLQGDELTQANALIAEYDSRSTTLQKLIYHEIVKAIAYKIEDEDDTIYHTAGAVNKTKVKADLGI